DFPEPEGAEMMKTVVMEKGNSQNLDAEARRRRENQEELSASLRLCVERTFSCHSRFSDCSRILSISAFAASARSVIVRPSSPRPPVFDNIVLASRFIS